MAEVSIRPMTPADIPSVRAVGVAAGRRFAEVDDPRVARCADDPPWSADEVAAHLARPGLDLVATVAGEVVGFLFVAVVDGVAHVDEVSVHPDHGGAGIGRRLLAQVDLLVARQGLAGATLTTFAEVAWNRPWYERRGYRVLAVDEQDDHLRRTVAEEAEAGLDPSIRVAMGKDPVPEVEARAAAHALEPHPGARRG